MRQRLLFAILAGLVLAPLAWAQQATTLTGATNEPFEVVLLRISASTHCQQDCIVRGQPYSAERVSESVQVLADGNRIVRRSLEKLYRDADGRTRVESEWRGKPLVQIQDPVLGMSYRLYPATKSGYKMTIAAPAAAGAVSISAAGTAPAPGAAQAAEQLAPTLASTIDSDKVPTTTRALGSREMEGVTVEGLQTTTTYPAGKAGNALPIVKTSESWRSRELRLMVYHKNVDPLAGERVTRLQNLSRVEPPAALFMAPADYAVQEIVRR